MRRLPALLLVALAPLPAARAASPELALVLPRGGQRGTEVQVTLRGKRLFDAEELVFYGPGLSARDLQVSGKGRVVTATVTIAPDCPLGEHALRLRCRSGLSELRTFWVGALPQRDEVEPNGAHDEAQTVELDVTVEGAIGPEDVDCFAFAGKAGQRVTAEVEAIRLGGPVFDPDLAILDARRFELATSDDTPRLGPDACASLVLPADGTYVVRLREAAYRGNDRFRYRLHLGTFPRPRAAYPSGGRPGEALRVDLLGDPAGVTSVVHTLPDRPGLAPLFPTDAAGVAPSPLHLRVSDLPATLEVEPNHPRRRATPAAFPGALEGRIERPGDIDWFRFTAKKGQRVRVRAWARGLGSPLDAVVNVFHAGGKHVKGNDDFQGTPDSEVLVPIPADGEYEVRVRDFLGRGGPGFVYRLEAAPVAPALSLDLQTYRRNSQERNAVAVPRGNRMAVLVRAARQDVGGPVAVDVGDLPAGIASVATAVCAQGIGVVPVVLEAAPGAALGAGLARLSGRVGEVSGELRQAIPLTFGRPNNAVYWTRTVDRLAVAVTEAAPFRLEVEDLGVPLVRSGSAVLDVRVVRDEGFDGQVVVSLLYDPPGTGSRKNVKVEKGQDRARIALNANGNAALGRWPLVAVGRASRRGPLWVSSAMHTLEVAQPFLALNLNRAAGEQGTTTEVAVEVQVARPFAGAARARLVRLPPHCTAPDLEITAETETLRFPVTIGAKAPPGRHRHIFCQVVVVADGKPIVHNLGSTELRVDRPRPDAPPPPPPPQPTAEAPPQAKPLSRLEQLRAEHEARKRADREEER